MKMYFPGFSSAEMIIGASISSEAIAQTVPD